MKPKRFRLEAKKQNAMSLETKMLPWSRLDSFPVKWGRDLTRLTKLTITIYIEKTVHENQPFKWMVMLNLRIIFCRHFATEKGWMIHLHCAIYHSFPDLCPFIPSNHSSILNNMNVFVLVGRPWISQTKFEGCLFLVSLWFWLNSTGRFSAERYWSLVINKKVASVLIIPCAAATSPNICSIIANKKLNMLRKI